MTNNESTVDRVLRALEPDNLIQVNDNQYRSNRPWSHVIDSMALVATITNGVQDALYFRGDECKKLNVSV